MHRRLAAAVVAVSLGGGLTWLGVTAAARPSDQPARPLPRPSAVTAVPLHTESVLSRTSAVVATARHGVTVFHRPGGRPFRRLSGRTPLDSVRTFLVEARRGDSWLRVELASRPNGSTGWVRASAVQLSLDPWRIRIDRRHHRLTLLRAGRSVARYPAATGTGGTPTPRGRFAVTDRIITGDPTGPFGPAALGLSAHSTVLHHFDGGDGVVGIHGTNAAWSVGRSASHGCIRLSNRAIRQVYHRVPLGTPVVIV